MKHPLGILTSLVLFLSACSPHTDSKTNPPGHTSRFVYVLNSGDNSISQYQINKDGELIPLSAASVATGQCPRQMVMDKKGEYVYVGNYCDDTISQFQVGQDGQLTEVGSRVSIPSLAEAMVMAPDGRFIYTTSFQDGSISQFKIATDGTLSLVGATPHPEAPLNLIFSPSGHYAYVASLAIDDITQYAVAADGSLSRLNPATVPSMACPSGPLGVKSVQNRDYVYVLSCGGSQIEHYIIGSDGTLSLQGAVATGLFPINFAVSKTTIYTANIGDSTISTFTIGDSSGDLRLVSSNPMPDGFLPEAVEVDDVNQEVYVLDFSSNQIVRFAKNLDGTLSSEPNLVRQTGQAPTKIIFK